MSTSRIAVFAVCIALSKFAVCQQQIADAKLKFGSLKCRTDAQDWTVDGSAVKSAADFQIISVNGQIRFLPNITYHVTVGDLVQRAYEMQVCKYEDADFERHFHTYTEMEQAYREQRTFRYMYFLTKHHMDEQFSKEDAEAFK